MSEILGVKIDNLSKKEILEKIDFFLDESKFHQVATVNPEFILEAQKNKKFRKTLNECDLNVADGFGINLGFWRKLKLLECRFSGVSLVEEILKRANERKASVFLACREDGLSTFEETKKVLENKYPKIRIFGENICDQEFDSIKNISCLVLLSNFGSPEQEIFIKSQKNDIIRLGIGVGGAFDFWTGKVKRAPRLMQKLGLEWFWRLLQQPQRFKRIFRAVIIFPIKVLINK